jgi:hypothetical protein
MSPKMSPKCRPNVAQNVAQPMFCQNLYKTGNVGKSGPKNCATNVTLKTLPKLNNRPKGENSPNLVTLAVTVQVALVRFVSLFDPGANPAIGSYNASTVKICYATSSLVRLENKNIFFYIEKTL